MLSSTWIALLRIRLFSKLLKFSFFKLKEFISKRTLCHRVTILWGLLKLSSYVMLLGIINGSAIVTIPIKFVSKLPKLLVNNEFYLDSMINDALDLGLQAKLFEVDYYLSWGTPNELRTFEYWERCFTKLSGHNFNGFAIF